MDLEDDGGELEGYTAALVAGEEEVDVETFSVQRIEQIREEKERKEKKRIRERDKVH